MKKPTTRVKNLVKVLQAINPAILAYDGLTITIEHDLGLRAANAMATAAGFGNVESGTVQINYKQASGGWAYPEEFTAKLSRRIEGIIEALPEVFPVTLTQITATEFLAMLVNYLTPEVEVSTPATPTPTEQIQACVTKLKSLREQIQEVEAELLALTTPVEGAIQEFEVVL